MNRLIVFVAKCRLWANANGCSTLEECDRQGVSELSRAELETSTGETDRLKRDTAPWWPEARRDDHDRLT